jgi:adenosine deaminase
MKTIKSYSQHLVESETSETDSLNDLWIVYVWSDYEAAFISAHTNEDSAQEAWEEAVIEHWGEEIDSWVDKHLPEGYTDAMELDAEAYKALYNEAIGEIAEWGADYMDFIMAPYPDLERDEILKDYMKGFNEQILQQPNIDPRIKRKIMRKSGMTGMFSRK